MTFTPNEKQEKAFDAVVKAMKEAKKIGLVFYGKGDTLVAYTKVADDYVNKHDTWELIGNKNEQLPCLSCLKVLSDSGADDYPCFANEEDERKYK